MVNPVRSSTGFLNFLFRPINMSVSPETFPGCIRTIRSSGICTCSGTQTGLFWTFPGYESGDWKSETRSSFTSDFLSTFKDRLRNLHVGFCVSLGESFLTS